MMTAIACRKAGIAFAGWFFSVSTFSFLFAFFFSDSASNFHFSGVSYSGVHDSYWTHACDVDEMSKILREKFVELYETPILEQVLYLLLLRVLQCVYIYKWNHFPLELFYRSSWLCSCCSVIGELSTIIPGTEFPSTARAGWFWRKECFRVVVFL